MHRLSVFTLLFVLLVSTCGVNISVEWCGDEWIGVKVNGIHLLSESGRMMGDCCSDDGAACDDCHHVSHFYQVSSQYIASQHFSLVPPSLSADGSQAFLFPKTIFFQTVEEGSIGRAGTGYATPFWRDAIAQRRGLRAPPALS